MQGGKYTQKRKKNLSTTYVLHFNRKKTNLHEKIEYQEPIGINFLLQFIKNRFKKNSF